MSSFKMRSKEGSRDKSFSTVGTFVETVYSACVQHTLKLSKKLKRLGKKFHDNQFLISLIIHILHLTAFILK